MAGVRFPLAARDRILLHLSDFTSLKAELPEYPPALTQDGIASRTGLARAHVALALKSAREEGLVDEVKGRVTGEARRRKIYLLSEPGKGRCRSLITTVMGSEVQIQKSGAQARKARLSEASFSLEKKVPLVELALSVQEGGILMLDGDGAPVRPAREEEPAEGAEAEAAGGEAAGPAGAPMPARADEAPQENVPVSSPAKLWDEPVPEERGGSQKDKESVETLDMDGAPRKLTSAGPVRADYGMPSARPGAPEGQAASGRPASPWVKRGQLAAVWIGAVVLDIVFLFFGAEIDTIDFTPDFLVIYFLVMVTLQWFLLGAKKAPANVRAEMGIYIGGFMALYGSVFAFLEPGNSTGHLFWFSEGLLLLSTGLLLHPLEPLRKFQVAGASAGSFIAYLCLLGLATNAAKGDSRMLGLGVMWFLIGCLLISSRILHARAEYAGWLRTAAALSAGALMMTVGAFLASKGLVAESFVEFLVGAAIVYYTAPMKREEWSAGLAICIGIICGTVAVTVYWLLIGVSAILRIV